MNMCPVVCGQCALHAGRDVLSLSAFWPSCVHMSSSHVLSEKFT